MDEQTKNPSQTEGHEEINAVIKALADVLMTNHHQANYAGIEGWNLTSDEVELVVKLKDLSIVEKEELVKVFKIRYVQG
jgi:hypothetical protein